MSYQPQEVVAQYILERPIHVEVNNAGKQESINTTIGEFISSYYGSSVAVLPKWVWMDLEELTLKLNGSSITITRRNA